jgi:osmotically inducible protein OsmC
MLVHLSTTTSVRTSKENHMKRSASAVWDGEFKSGKGRVSTESGVLKESQYSFGTRFENGPGTNPEELIAAAHAGCFAMALSAFLGKAGFSPKRISTKANVTLEQVNGNWTITTIDLDLEAQIPGISREKFEEVANDAKANCPVSRVLNAKINLRSTLQA